MVFCLHIKHKRAERSPGEVDVADYVASAVIDPDMSHS